MLIAWLGMALFAAVCMAALAGVMKAQQGIQASRHQSMTAYASYIQGQQDKHDLNRFGLAQQLRRKFGAAASFGLSFNSLGLIGTAVIFLGPAVMMGGPSVISIGLPIAAIFGLAVSASLAELSSAVPTSGGVYHWSSALGRRRWGWHAGWFHIAGYVTMIALVNGACAAVLDSLLATRFGYSSSLWSYVLLTAILIASQAAINHWGTNALGLLQQAGIWLQAIIALALISGLAFLFWPGFYSPAVMYAFQNESLTGPVPIMSFLGGVLFLQKLFLGMDGAAQGAEETSDPRIRVPWAIYMSTVYTFIVGFVLLMFITLLMPAFNELDAVGSGGSVVVAAALDMVGGSPIVVIAIVAALWGSSCSTLTVCSRALFSMARDNALPFSRKWASIGVKTQAPEAAVWLIAALVLITLLTVRLISADTTTLLFGFMLLCLNAAYAIPLSLKIKRRGNHQLLKEAPWHLGKWSFTVNVIALVWLLLTSAASIFVFGIGGAIAVAVLLILTLMADLKFRARHLAKLQSRLKRPRGEIIRMERKFPVE